MYNNGDYGDSLKELAECEFVRFIRKKMTNRLASTLFSNYCIFVPSTSSLPLVLRRKDISNSLSLLFTSRKSYCYSGR